MRDEGTSRDQSKRLATNRPQPWQLSVAADRIEHMIEALAACRAGEVDDLTASELLATIQASREIENAEAARQLVLAAQWADLHPPESVHDAASFSVASCGREHEEPIAGEGAPLVAEFCLAELGAALGVSTTAAKRLVGQALELRHRLPPQSSDQGACGITTRRSTRWLARILPWDMWTSLV